MSNNTTVNVIILLMLSLTISSFLISYFAVESYGYDLDSIDIPSNMDSYSNVQDFKTNAINVSTLKSNSGAVWSYQEGVGRVLTSKPVTVTSFLWIDNIRPANGVVKNTYYINNSVKNIFGLHPDYGITIRYTGSYDEVDVYVQGDGLLMPNFGAIRLPVGTRDFKPVANLNQVENAVIVTEYNQDKNTLVFTFNGVPYYFNNCAPDQNFYGLFGRYYGGVISEELGFTVERFETINSVTKDVNTLDVLSSLLPTMFKIVTWGLPSYIMPIELQFLMIRTQEAALLIAIAALIWRG